MDRRFGFHTGFLGWPIWRDPLVQASYEIVRIERGRHDLALVEHLCGQGAERLFVLVDNGDHASAAEARPTPVPKCGWS